MKKFFSAIIGYSFIIYILIGIYIYYPYFQKEDENHHGIIYNSLLSKHVSLLKSFIWPYYALTIDHNSPSIDWNAKIKNDFRAVITVLNNDTNNTDIVANNKNKELLSQVFKNYPPKHLITIENAVQSYIKYEIMTCKEMLIIILGYNNSSPWTEPKALIQIRKGFEEYYTETEMKIILNFTSDSVNNAFNIHNKYHDNQEDLTNAYNRYSEYIQMMTERSQSLFKDIFSKDLIL